MLDGVIGAVVAVAVAVAVALQWEAASIGDKVISLLS